MAVSLRLARHGKKKSPFYRIVAAEQEYRRDGRHLEIVGTFNPMVDPPVITLKEDRVRHWIENGAQTTRVVSGIIEKSIPGLIKERKEKQRAKIQEQRKKRKERNAGKPKAKKDKPKKKKKKEASKAA